MSLFKTINIHKTSILFVYLFVNAMFVLKYGVRQSFISEYILLIFYIVFIIASISVLKKLKSTINNWRYFHRTFITIILLVFAVFTILNFYVDGNSLNTDRWSALKVSIESVLNLDYPYDKLDHLGGTSSNLPGLIYIGLPFYLIGNIGLLQPFVFLLMMFMVAKLKYKNSEKFTFLFLLLSSLAFLWEVVAKSDLMSNVILVVLFMIYWNQKYKEDYFQKPVLLGFLSSFLVLTRGFIAIPLTIFLFKGFVKSRTKVKIIFVLGLLFGILFWSLPILISLPDVQTMRDHNPFFNQTAYAPIWLIIVFLVFPFLVSLISKNFQQVLFASFAFLSLMFLGLFLYNTYDEGWYNNLIGGLFDISYLGITIPFTLWAYFEMDSNKSNFMQSAS